VPLKGQVTISSSGPAEPSQEWDSLGGSLFTHHLLTGLRGDADADSDGKVTLSEAYAYAYRRTVVEAAGGATQHPAFDVDLTGSGELVLSEPASARSALVFPAPLEGHYLVASQPRPDVVAEVDKRAGKTLRLAVPPGHYILRKRLGATVGLLDVDLPYGGEKAVEESQMVRRHFAEVAMKGGFVELRPSALIATGSIETPPLYGAGPRWRLGAGFQRTWGEWWGLAALSFGRARFRGIDLTTTEASSTLDVSGGYRWIFSALIAHAGLSVEMVGLDQISVRDREQEIQQVFGQGPLPARLVLGFSLGPVAGMTIPLPANAFVLAQASGLVRFLPAENQPQWTFGLRVYVGAGVKF
jgi:hypothetical protein